MSEDSYMATVTFLVTADDEVDAADVAQGYVNVLNNAGAEDVRLERIN